MSSSVLPALTETESTRLSTLEAAIEQGLTTFIEVGSALFEIRGSRLYRETHDTFEHYCKSRWGMTARRANQLVSAAEIVSVISDNGNHGSQTPANERQVRPLAELPEKERADAWQEAVETAPTGKPTAKEVKAVVDRKLGKAKPKPRLEPEPEPPKSSRVNGVVAHDPPDIAAIRKAGGIPADAVVDIDEPEPIPDEPEDSPDLESEGEVHPSEPTEDEWLDSLPLSSVLVGSTLRVFRRDALTYRRLESARKTYQVHFRREVKPIARQNPGVAVGDYEQRTSWWLRLEHPKDWKLCPPVDHEGCNGTGNVELIGQCPKCHGRGYRLY